MSDQFVVNGQDYLQISVHNLDLLTRCSEVLDTLSQLSTAHSSAVKAWQDLGVAQDVAPVNTAAVETAENIQRCLRIIQYILYFREEGNAVLADYLQLWFSKTEYTYTEVVIMMADGVPEEHRDGMASYLSEIPEERRQLLLENEIEASVEWVREQMQI